MFWGIQYSICPTNASPLISSRPACQVTQSINQSINQSVSQSINQPINQATSLPTHGANKNRASSDVSTHEHSPAKNITLFHAISRFSVNVSKNKKTIRQLFTPNHAKSRFAVCTSKGQEHNPRRSHSRTTKFVGSFTPNRLLILGMQV